LVGRLGTIYPKENYLQSQQKFSPETRVMEHGFLSSSVKEYFQMMKRQVVHHYNILGTETKSVATIANVLASEVQSHYITSLELLSVAAHGFTERCSIVR